MEKRPHIAAVSYDRSSVSGSQKALERVIEGLSSDFTSSLHTSIDECFQGSFDDCTADICFTQQWAAYVTREQCRNGNRKVIPVVHYSHGPNQLSDDYDLALACSNSVFVEDHKKFPNQDMMIVHPPMSKAIVDHFYANNNTQKKEDQKKDETKEKYILMAGIYAQKGHAIALEVARRMPEHQFVLVTDMQLQTFLKDPEELKVFEQLSSSLRCDFDFRDISVPPNVKEIASTNDVIKDLFQNAKLVLMPSRYESFGMFPVEAVFCGVPCVCTDLPGLREAFCHSSFDSVFDSSIIIPDCAWVDPLDRAKASVWVDRIQKMLALPEIEKTYYLEKVAKRFLERQTNEISTLKNKLLHLVSEQQPQQKQFLVVKPFSTTNDDKEKSNEYKGLYPLKNWVHLDRGFDNVWDFVCRANEEWERNKNLQYAVFLRDENADIDVFSKNFLFYNSNSNNQEGMGFTYLGKLDVYKPYPHMKIYSKTGNFMKNGIQGLVAPLPISFFYEEKNDDDDSKGKEALIVSKRFRFIIPKRFRNVFSSESQEMAFEDFHEHLSVRFENLKHQLIGEGETSTIKTQFSETISFLNESLDGQAHFRVV